MRLPTLPIDPSAVHGAFMALGTLAAVIVFLIEARRRRTLDDRLFMILTGALFCGGVAAKLSTSWRYSRRPRIRRCWARSSTEGKACSEGWPAPTSGRS